MTNYFGYFNSPIGILELHANEKFLLQLSFVEQKSKAEFKNQIIEKTNAELNAYFTESLTEFSIPLHFQGTPFQEYVWNELKNIPFGTTISYQKFAEKLGNPKAIRAVGTTNGKNPFPIILPCHRVVGSNGKLVGYVGGVSKKQWLINMEARSSGLYLL